MMREYHSPAQIGPGARGRIDGMMALVDSARQPDFPEVDALFAQALERLAAAHARVSVVGQVKAGKSSLINVLTGQPGLLPTEVNPWTAVITNLHFGHPDKPHHGGAFQLFSEEEWQRMIEGDSKTRAMAEELLPGFDSETLKRQVQEMQDTARRRLGALYRHLLGKKHKFSVITPEILERYVSAGHQQADSAEAENAGRFSGITKSAEVFLEAAPFALPVTISDTPGINDPFLVRDEITTSSFRETDIFVVALSVHQALSAADMALLRMLSRHSGKSIIVFVNRIDEADNPAKDVPAVMDALRARLEAELPMENITLIAGSAHWGALALFGSDSEVTAALDAPGCAGLCPKNGPARERLYQGSGFPALAAALSDAIESGPVSRKLAEIASEVRAAFRMQQKLVQERLAQEEVVLLEVGDIPAILEAEKNRLITRINQFADLADELDAGEDSARARLLQNADVVSRSIANTVDATLGKFVDGEIARMKAGLAGGEKLESWSLDTATLHEKIESQVVQSYAEGRHELDELFTRYAETTHARMAKVLGEIDISGLLDNLPHDEFLPGYKPDNTLVRFDLVKDNGWKFWKKAELTEEEALARLEQMIRQATFPAITACCDAARLAMAERTGEAQNRIARIKEAARALVVDEVLTMKAEIETLDQGVSADAVARLNDNRKARAAGLRQRLETLSAQQDKLNALFPEAAPPQLETPASGGEK